MIGLEEPKNKFDGFCNEHLDSSFLLADLIDCREEAFMAHRSPEFPTFQDLIRFAETQKPQYFNYFSIHGLIVFIRFKFHNYEVVAKNWDAPHLLGCECIEHNRHQMSYVIRKTREYDLALGSFYHAVQWLLDNGRKYTYA